MLSNLGAPEWPYLASIAAPVTRWGPELIWLEAEYLGLSRLIDSLLDLRNFKTFLQDLTPEQVFGSHF